MEWRHNVGEKWLQARRRYLTASEVKSLITEWRRISSGKMKLSESRQMAKLYGEKRVLLPDTFSSGAMARGHVMEPFAVDECNKLLSDRMESYRYNWWDDRIIARGEVAFSPDALDIPCFRGTGGIVLNDGYIDTVQGVVEGPTRVLEIKSYSAGTHYQRRSDIVTGQKIEERWQIAMAMHVCPTIETGTVMFYAPQCSSEFFKVYERSDLEEEMRMIADIEKAWSTYKEIVNSWSGEYQTTYSEEFIHNAHLMNME